MKGNRVSRGGAWRNQPATVEQRSYLEDLCGQAKVDPHLPPGLSRGDASDLIEHLKGVLSGERPSGEVPPLLAMYHERRTVTEYRKSQHAQFPEHGCNNVAPKGRGRPGKVWKKWPNQMRTVGVITYGWHWRCEHPDHRQAVSANLGRYSFEQALAKINAHMAKYHSGNA